MHKLASGWHVALLAASLMWLSACGYHLRSSGQLVQRWPALAVAQPETALGRQLVRQLELAGVQSNRPGAPALHVLDAGFRRKVLSLDSRGRVSEYRLVYRVRFQLRAEGRYWPEREIRLQQAFNFEDDQILGKFRQEHQLREEMLREAAVRVLEALLYLPEGETVDATETPG